MTIEASPWPAAAVGARLGPAWRQELLRGRPARVCCPVKGPKLKAVPCSSWASRLLFSCVQGTNELMNEPVGLRLSESYYLHTGWGRASRPPISRTLGCGAPRRSALFCVHAAQSTNICKASAWRNAVERLGTEGHCSRSPSRGSPGQQLGSCEPGQSCWFHHSMFPPWLSGLRWERLAGPSPRASEMPALRASRWRRVAGPCTGCVVLVSAGFIWVAVVGRAGQYIQTGTGWPGSSGRMKRPEPGHTPRRVSPPACGQHTCVPSCSATRALPSSPYNVA